MRVGVLGWWSEGYLAKREAQLGTGRVTMVRKRLIPGRKEMGRELIGEELGSGSLGALDGRDHKVTSFIQPPPYFRWNVTQNWTPPRPLFSRSVTLLHAQPGPLSRALYPES